MSTSEVQELWSDIERKNRLDTVKPANKVYLPTPKQQRIEFLERHRVVIQAHMKTRAEDADWHGVSDDANDLREVDAELRGLRF